MLSRREFMGAMTVPAASVAGATLLPEGVLGALRAVAAHGGAPQEVARDEDFWFEVSRAYTVDRSIVNLNNGGVSPASRFVQEAMKRHLDFSHKAPAYTMWEVLEPQREAVRQRLAQHFGTSPEELALTRNASEGLQTCQFGIDLKPGDEVLTTNQDYPRMINTFKQRERREGIVLKQFSIPTPCEEPEHIVARFQQHITPRTRMMLVSHMVFLTGQILPVKEVAALGRSRGIPVVIDGAHALAHFEFKISDLDCDYYASSLHKWLSAPHGTGLLYVRRERIGDLWPLMAADASQDGDIRKFEEIGTHPAANYLAVGEALSFYQGVGASRKQARLTYLRDYWAKRLSGHDRVRLHTSLQAGMACGIANFEVLGLQPKKLVKWLWDRHRILTVAIEHDEFQGVRVSPNVYTTLSELDRFCEAVEHAISEGLPA